MSLFTRFVLIACAAALLASCGSNTGPADVSGTDMVTTTIVGHVVDEEGNAIPGASIIGHGATSTTDEHGVFVLKDVRTPSDRCHVVVQHEGYITSSRAVFPSRDEVSLMRLTLLERVAPKAIESEKGGTVNIGSMWIRFAADGFARADGSVHSGTVHCSLRYSKSTASNFSSTFPADMTAERVDGSKVHLRPRGFVHLMLWGSDEQPLALRSDTSARVTMRAPLDTLYSMPLWRFDETKGMWLEHGLANVAGDVYVGYVDRSGWWCLGTPSANVAMIEGTVKRGDLPLPGLTVMVGQSAVITDEHGVFRALAPAGEMADIEVRPEENHGALLRKVQVGPLTHNQTLRREFVLSSGPAIVTGTMVNCIGEPAGGIVYAVHADGAVVGAAQRGRLTVIVPSNMPVTLTGRDFSNVAFKPVSVGPIALDSTVDVVRFRVCDSRAIDTRDVLLTIASDASVVTLNVDGSRAAVIAGDALLCLSTASGTEQWRAQLPPWIDRASCRMQFVGTDERIIVTSRLGVVILNGQTGAELGAIDLPRHYAVHDNGRFIYALSDTSLQAEGLLYTEHDAWTGALLRTMSILTTDRRTGTLLGIVAGVMYVESESNSDWRMWNARSTRNLGRITVTVSRSISSVLSPRASIIATTSQTPLKGRMLALVDVNARLLQSETPFAGSRLLAIAPSDSDLLIYDSLQSRIVSKDVTSFDEQYEMPLPNDSPPLMRGMACYSHDGRLLCLLATDNMKRRTILRLVQLK